MPMTAAKFVPFEMKSSFIKVLSYEQKNPTGFLVNPYFAHEMYFGNLTQLLFLIDELLTAINYPQESFSTRSFKKNNDREAVNGPKDDELLQKPVLATFKVNVLFRQNASWQGSIHWVEDKMESQFRSVLELIMLMDSVLSGVT